jgi:hypothetical protein
LGALVTMGFSELEKKTVSITTEEYATSSISGEEVLCRDDEPKYNVFKQPRAWWNQNYLSWRFYVTIYAALAMVVVLVLLIALVLGISLHGIDHQGRITLYEGSCAKAKKSSFFAHAFISGMGTYMLSASAYVMVGYDDSFKELELIMIQYCLTPPSREEIDREHARGRWLDIGAMSIRNLLRISKKRTMFFLLLGLSSPILQFL